MQWHKFGEKKPKHRQKVVVKKAYRTIEEKIVWEALVAIHRFEEHKKFNPDYWEWGDDCFYVECHPEDKWLDPDEE